jgi:hypothetical protein
MRPGPIVGEFALVFTGKLTATPFAHLCLRCKRGSARPFYCTQCNTRSVTAGVALLHGVAA